MTITITNYKSMNLGNLVSDPLINPSNIADSSWIISSISATKIVATTKQNGTTLSTTLEGNLDIKNATGIKTLADLVALPFDKSNTLSLQTISVDGQLVGSIASSLPLPAGLWGASGTSSLAAQIFYSGKLLFNSGDGESNGDRFYGYTGFATYKDDHTYSTKEKDIFIGGSGGINKLVLPAKKSSYSMAALTFKDENSQVSKSLSGWEITDNAKIYATVDISGVQRIDFKDTSLALDLTGNAGIVVKVLGATFGSSLATNKEYVGIGLSLVDSGVSYSELMNLALTVKLGAGFTNEQEIQLLYQNLFGRAAPKDEFSAIEYFISCGQYTQATLGVLAAETTNNIAKINLVGLAQTGIEYIPVS
jgi:hypothetical protein